jgi:hypothetical protein
MDRQERRRTNSQARAARRRMYGHMAILVFLTVGILAAMAWLIHNGKRTDALSAAPPATGAPGELAPLKGRWQRPDGGYVVEIKEIDAQGKVSAAYFNPRPIHVSQAAAARDRGATKLFIELRDTNYPGATYHLTYDPDRDELRGVYFQPALQQRFDVVFVRMK